MSPIPTALASTTTAATTVVATITKTIPTSALTTTTTKTTTTKTTTTTTTSKTTATPKTTKAMISVLMFDRDWYPMYYPAGMKARVSPVQSIEPHRILALTRDLNREPLGPQSRIVTTILPLHTLHKKIMNMYVYTVYRLTGNLCFFLINSRIEIILYLIPNSH